MRLTLVATRVAVAALALGLVAVPAAQAQFPSTPPTIGKPKPFALPKRRTFTAAPRRGNLH